MYLEIDLAGPIQGTFLTNTKVRNKILNSSYKWPTKWVDGIEVLDEVTLYHGGAKNYPNLYQVLGMSYRDLANNNWQGVDRMWMYWQPVHLERQTVTMTELQNYIDFNSTLDEEIEVGIQYTQKVGSVSLRSKPVVTEEQIIAMIEGGYDSTYPVPIVKNSANRQTTNEVVYNKTIGYDLKASNVTFVSLMDTNDDLFDSETTIDSMTVTPVYSSDQYYSRGRTITSYTIVANATYKFTRKVAASDASASSLLDFVLGKMNTETKFTGMSIYKQLGIAVQHLAGTVVNDDLYYTQTFDDNRWGNSQNKTYVRVGVDPIPEIRDEDGNIIQARVPGSGLRGLKKKTFTNLMARSIDTDYTQVKQSGWSSFLSFVLIVVIVVVSIYTGGAAAGASGAAAGSVGAAAAFMAGFSLALSIGVLATSLMAKAALNSGNYQMSLAFRNSTVTLNTLATISGYVSMVLGIAAFIQAAKQAVGQRMQDEAIKQAGEQVATDLAFQSAGQTFAEASMGEIMETVMDMAVDAVVETATNTFDSVVSAFTPGVTSSLSTGEILTAGIKYLGYAFEGYKKLFPLEDPGTPATKSTDEVPNSIEQGTLIYSYMDNDMMYELNLLMDNSYYNMTEGTIDDKFSKFYSNSRPV